jgi:histidinol phosphatase-like PHP family hydrolase
MAQAMGEKSEERERFERLAEKRTNAVIKKLDVLGHCANRNQYEYEKEEVEEIFKAIRKKTKNVKSQFEFPEEDEFNL